MEIAAAREAPSRRRFVELAHECGFELAGVAPALPLGEFAFYRQWVADGLAGPMGYLTDHRMEVRSDPRQLLSSARSVLCLGKLYNTVESVAGRCTTGGTVPFEAENRTLLRQHRTANEESGQARISTAPSRSRLRPETEPRPSGSGGIAVNSSAVKPAASPSASGPSGDVSRYAWGSGDYHDVLRNSLESLAARLREVWGEFDYRVCVDTAPLLERAYASAAGLGWIGRNTCLINEPLGSWFFLGEILISLELPPDSPPPDRCGSCTRCVDACPTQALIPVPGTAGPKWQLDARLCISTLTIEQKGATAEAARAGTGYHLFGCDICQQVCPWNRRAPVSDEPGFQALNARLDLNEMAALTRDEFRARFRSTPVWRAKHEGWLRNVATVMGNSGDARSVAALRGLARSTDAGVAEHAAWALRQLQHAGTSVESPRAEPPMKETE
jgi:epoxyqueuosine reductase